MSVLFYDLLVVVVRAWLIKGWTKRSHCKKSRSIHSSAFLRFVTIVFYCPIWRHWISIIVALSVCLDTNVLSCGPNFENPLTTRLSFLELKVRRTSLQLCICTGNAENMHRLDPVQTMLWESSRLREFQNEEAADDFERIRSDVKGI